MLTMIRHNTARLKQQENMVRNNTARMNALEEHIERKMNTRIKSLEDEFSKKNSDLVQEVRVLKEQISKVSIFH